MQTALSLLITYKYWLLFPLAAFEGPIVALVAGFMVYMGYLSFLPAYILLLLGDLIPDTFYYYLGRYGDQKQLFQKYGAKHDFVAKNFELIRKLWTDHGRKTMFLSKLAYGLSTIFLISAGLVKMPFKKFVSYAFPITVFQYGIIMIAGFYMGHSYALAEQYIKSGAYVVAGILVIFVTAYILVTKYARKEITKLEKEEESKK